MLIFVPGSLLDPWFLYLGPDSNTPTPLPLTRDNLPAFGVAVGAFLIAEQLRMGGVPPYGQTLQRFVEGFIDERDRGAMVRASLIGHLEALKRGTLGRSRPIFICSSAAPSRCGAFFRRRICCLEMAKPVLPWWRPSPAPIPLHTRVSLTPSPAAPRGPQGRAPLWDSHRGGRGHCSLDGWPTHWSTAVAGI